MASYPVGCFIREYEIMFSHIRLFYFEVMLPFSDSYIFNHIFYDILHLSDEWQSSTMNEKKGAKIVKYGLEVASCLILKKRVIERYIFEVLNHFKNLQL